MTATHLEIGRRIVELEQGGEERAEDGAKLLETLAADLTRRSGCRFSRQPSQCTRQFYVAFPPDKIRQTLSSKSETVSRILPLTPALRSPRCPGRTMSCLRREPARRGLERHGVALDSDASTDGNGNHSRSRPAQLPVARPHQLPGGSRAPPCHGPHRALCRKAGRVQVLFAGFAPGHSNAAMVNPRITALLRSPRPDEEWHSGELETAMVLAVHPGLDRRALARRLPPGWVDVRRAPAAGRTTFREMIRRAGDTSAGRLRRAPRPAAPHSSSGPD